MNVATFRTQVSAAWAILEAVDVGEERIPSPLYPASLAAKCRALTYRDQWRWLLSQQAYNFQLRDFSLVQLRYEGADPLRLSYVYYRCPFKCIGYSEYLAREGLTGADRYDSDVRDLYESYVANCPPREHVTPIRYDHDPTLF